MNGELRARLLVCLESIGPQGIRTSDLASLVGATPRTIEGYILRHRHAGGAVWTLRTGRQPGLVFTNQEDMAAAKQRQTLETSVKRKAAKRTMDAARRSAATSAAKLEARKLQVAAAEQKPKAEVWRAECTGPLPAAHVLPHQPVYSRHQLAGLPPGFVSALSASECRPWAAMVGQR